MLPMIRSFDQVSVDWVAQVLRVPIDKIASVNVRRLWDPSLSRIAVVDIDYKSKTHDEPASVFLKITRDDLPKELSWIGKKETYFFNEIVPRFRSENIPLCYSARFDEENKLFNLVLEDLSRTHFQVAYPLAPHARYLEAAVRCLARIHADWWDREELRQVTDGYPTEKRLSEWTDYLRKSGLELLEFLGDALPQVGHRIVRTVLDHREVVSKRYLSGENLTLVHTDAHFWNFFFPKESSGITKVFDWGGFQTGMGTDDLAYMIAMHCFPSHRKEHEYSLLECYHSALTDSGIRNYTLKDLVNDYRLSVLSHVTTPIWKWHAKLPANVWFFDLDLILTAYEDLECEALLGK